MVTSASGTRAYTSLSEALCAQHCLRKQPSSVPVCSLQCCVALPELRRCTAEHSPHSDHDRHLHVSSQLSHLGLAGMGQRGSKAATETLRKYPARRSEPAHEPPPAVQQGPPAQETTGAVSQGPGGCCKPGCSAELRAFMCR